MFLFFAVKLSCDRNVTNLWATIVTERVRVHCSENSLDLNVTMAFFLCWNRGNSVRISTFEVPKGQSSWNVRHRCSRNYILKWKFLIVDITLKNLSQFFRLPYCLLSLHVMLWSHLLLLDSCAADDSFSWLWLGIAVVLRINLWLIRCLLDGFGWWTSM